MAQERGYQRQLDNGAPIGAARASAAAFGAGVAAGMVDIADSLHRSDMQTRAIERQQTADTEAASAAARIADAQLALSKARDDARAGNAYGGTGHADAMASAFDGVTKGIVDDITEDRVRRAVTTQLTQMRGSFLAGEHAWQTGAQAKYRVDNMRAVGGKYSAGVSTGGISAADAYTAIDDMLDTMDGIGDLREPVRRELREQVAIADGQRQIRVAPKALIASIDAGAYNDVLDGQQLERLRGGAEIEIRRVEAAAKAEAALAITIEKEAIATRRAELDAGAGTPQDWADVAARYEQLGDTSSAVTARAKGAGMAATIGYRDENLPQLDGRIASLTAKRNGGGLSTAEAATLSGLQDLRGQLAGMLGQPGGALMAQQFATGKPIAPLDPNNPSSMRTRAIQAKAAAQRYGRPLAEPILATELPTFRDLVVGGAQQKLQAIQMIQQFGDPQVVRAAGVQIAGDDGAFRIASQLPIEVAREVLRGNDALKSGPQVWKEDRARADFSKWYGGMLRFIDGSYRDDVFQAAKSFYGGRAVDGGEQQYNPGRFAEAIETVLGRMSGANGATGGIARHSRGIVLVPQGMKPDALLQRFARGSIDDYRQASGGRKPVWSDGSTLTRGQLRTLLPTAIDGAGHYGFRGPGGRLVEDERGQPYVVDINRLGR